MRQGHEEEARNPVNRMLSESNRAPAKPAGAFSGELVTEMFEHDSGRQVTVCVPPDPRCHETPTWERLETCLPPSDRRHHKRE
jgi:hypothetical protein